MKIKRFFAPDMRQAIHEVREEQGPDAVILSTRTTADGVEIVAAVDYDAELVNGMLGTGEGVAELVVDEREARPASRPSRSMPTAAIERRPAESDGESPLAAMQAELRSLRRILQDQVSRIVSADHDRRYPLRAEIIHRLVGLGLDEDMAREIGTGTSTMRGATPAWREALVALARSLPVVESDPLDRGGLIALVGATGVGKTTTVAKLATRACARFGSGEVALISTDDFRVGGQRQLESFGLLLGVPVRQARSGEELRACLAEFAGRRLVLVDTAGMGQKDLRLLDEMRKLTGVENLQSYLVLPANIQRDVMEDVVIAFSRDRLAGCILTKVDETARLGAALSTLITQRLPIAYTSNGQRVPEDLTLARRQDLVASAVSLAAKHSRRLAAAIQHPVKHNSEVSHVHA